MKQQTLRHLIIFLLLFTGVFHLAVALLGSNPDMTAGLAVFGLIYVGLSFYVRRDVHEGAKVNGRTAIIVAMAATALGLILGGMQYAQTKGPLSLLLMLVIDVAIIAAGAVWLARTHAKT